MKIPTFTIESQEDIKSFLTWLASNDILLHPDDSFTWIVDFAEDEEPCITRQQGEYLDDVMDKCFEVCEANGYDIYELARRTAVPSQTDEP